MSVGSLAHANNLVGSLQAVIDDDSLAEFIKLPDARPLLEELIATPDGDFEKALKQKLASLTKPTTSRRAPSGAAMSGADARKPPQERERKRKVIDLALEGDAQTTQGQEDSGASKKERLGGRRERDEPLMHHTSLGDMPRIPRKSKPVPPLPPSLHFQSSTAASLPSFDGPSSTAPSPNPPPVHSTFPSASQAPDFPDSAAPLEKPPAKRPRPSFHPSVGQAGKFEHRIFLPVSHEGETTNAVRLLIGTQGAQARKIEARTGAHIQINGIKRIITSAEASAGLLPLNCLITAYSQGELEAGIGAVKCIVGGAHPSNPGRQHKYGGYQHPSKSSSFHARAPAPAQLPGAPSNIAFYPRLGGDAGPSQQSSYPNSYPTNTNSSISASPYTLPPLPAGAPPLPSGPPPPPPPPLPSTGLPLSGGAPLPPNGGQQYHPMYGTSEGAYGRWSSGGRPWEYQPGFGGGGPQR